MIIKVVANISESIANYVVTYDSGRDKKFTHRDVLPKPVIDFMRSIEPVKHEYPYYTKYVYIYTNRKEDSR